MISDSIRLVTAIDLTIIVVILLALSLFIRQRKALIQVRVFGSMMLIFLGLILIGLFYLTDLLIIYVAPLFVGPQMAMLLIELLHENIIWLVNLLVVGLIVVGFLHINRILSGLGGVTAAAMAVEAGQYDPGMLADVSARSDEVGHLGRVFQQMIRTVDEREANLRREVNHLRIRVDNAVQDKQVKAITGTDFFHQLEIKAAKLRSAAAGDEG